MYLLWRNISGRENSAFRKKEGGRVKQPYEELHTIHIGDRVLRRQKRKGKWHTLSEKLSKFLGLSGKK